MNYAFRSHLMQQFAAGARNQSRPPLVLASSNSSAYSITSEYQSARSVDNNVAPISNSEHISNPRARNERFSMTSSRSARFSAPNNDKERADDEDGSKNLSVISPLAKACQDNIKSRRSVSQFIPTTQTDISTLQASIHRAIDCAIYAPHQRRTEPWSFKQIVTPNNKSRLTEICYNVAYRRKLLQNEGDEEKAKFDADAKTRKWETVPTFLVALVNGQTKKTYQNDHEYEELPLSLPTSERQLEDYAATCAAVQNILLSLHSEGLASKWSTSPVIKTPAFRNLVCAKEDELVVALIMIGLPIKVASRGGSRRRLQSDVLQSI